MDSTGVLDLQSPPRKRMRKGTKSCTECRRRKIRCTYEPGRPGMCKECRIRGSICIDQEHGLRVTNPSTTPNGEQAYSLRERVTRLESILEGMLKKELDQSGARASLETSSPSTLGQETGQAAKVLNNLRSAIPSPPTESEIDSSSEGIGNAPILQLFDNCVVSRKEDMPSSSSKPSGSRDMSPKAQAARSALLSLLPPREDVSKIIDSVPKRCDLGKFDIPEICDTCRLSSKIKTNCCESAPAEVAKVLIYLAITVKLLPLDFDYAAMQRPFNPQEFANHCITEICRLIIHDDDFAVTLSGVECQLLLSKYHLNDGRPRKAWLANRRAIEFGQIAGMHLSTAKPPRPGDTLFDRRLRIWCILVTDDRFLSFFLGLPYAVSDTAIMSQLAVLQQREFSFAENYYTRLGIIIGKLVDRSQDAYELSLSSVLDLDQDLEDMAKESQISLWDTKPVPDEVSKEYYDHVTLQFIHHFFRALLHLPFMLKSAADGKFQYCHVAAVESSRSALRSYKVLRSSPLRYLCMITDFSAFMLAMLLVIHLYGYSEESPTHSKEQDKGDWDLVKETTEILRQAATDPGGSVAAESANILDCVCSCNSDEGNLIPFPAKACQITVPYFGTITVEPGKKFLDHFNRKKQHQGPQYSSSSCEATSSQQLYTPPLSNAEQHLPSRQDDSTSNRDQTAAISQAVDHSEVSWGQIGNNMTMPNVDLDLDVNGFQSFLDGIGQGVWPTCNVDLGLDQGWNLNWYDDWNGGSTF